MLEFIFFIYELISTYLPTLQKYCTDSRSSSKFVYRTDRWATLCLLNCIVLNSRVQHYSETND
jgi:hypothetical protein